MRRLIGSILRECLDHLIIFSERHLRRVLAAYFTYYHRARTLLLLHLNASVPRAAQLPAMGRIVAYAHLGGLPHQYERRAA